MGMWRGICHPTMHVTPSDMSSSCRALRKDGRLQLLNISSTVQTEKLMKDSLDQCLYPKIQYNVGIPNKLAH